MTITPRVLQELQRLYQVAPLPLPWLGAAADADTAPLRVFVIEVARPAQWAPLQALWQAVQADLGWPAPAIAVNGVDGLQLWFSLAEAAPLARVQAAVAALCARYLAEVPARRLRSWPPAPGAEAAASCAVPAPQAGREVWSAFVAADLAPLFEDTPWLDLPPGDDAQAGLLLRCRSIARAAFETALAGLLAAQQAATPLRGEEGPALPSAAFTRPVAVAAAAQAAQAASAPAAAMPAPAQAAAQAFLLGVMHDATAPLALRIEAARALLQARPSGP